MIIALYGREDLCKNISNILYETFSFEIVNLKDAAKRFCEQIFDFKPRKLWDDDLSNQEDDRYKYLYNKEEAVHLSPKIAVDSLISWGHQCSDGQIWADYALHIANALLEKSEFDDVAIYEKRNGISYSTFPYAPIKNVCLTGITSSKELKKLKENNVKIIYVKSKNKNDTLDIPLDLSYQSLCNFVLENDTPKNLMIDLEDLIKEIYERKE